MSSDLGKARGLGSAKSGVHHWMHQRLTAIANLLLLIWAVISVLLHHDHSYAEWRGFLAQPHNAVLTILLVISTFYHAVLGAQVITEDYIHTKGLKYIKLIGQRLIYFALGAAAIFSVLQIAL
mgnify:CR=1 FL=1